MGRTSYEAVVDSPNAAAAAASTRRGYAAIPAEGDVESRQPAAVPAAAVPAAAAAGVAPNGSGTPRAADAFLVKVLDVRGATYEVTASPGDTIVTLKKRLAVVSSVEVERQRVIHMGRVLSDADTLASAKVQPGTVLHLFQRPKSAMQSVNVLVQGQPNSSSSSSSTTAAGAAASSSSNGVPVLPDLIVQAGNGLTANPLYGHEAWSLERARRSMRLLASCLFLISTMQVTDDTVASDTSLLSYTARCRSNTMRKSKPIGKHRIVV
jgi:Ubiquitin family